MAEGETTAALKLCGFALLIYQSSLQWVVPISAAIMKGINIIERGLRKSRLVPRFRCAFIALIDEAGISSYRLFLNA